MATVQKKLINLWIIKSLSCKSDSCKQQPKSIESEINEVENTQSHQKLDGRQGPTGTGEKTGKVGRCRKHLLLNTKIV